MDSIKNCPFLYCIFLGGYWEAFTTRFIQTGFDDSSWIASIRGWSKKPFGRDGYNYVCWWRVFTFGKISLTNVFQRLSHSGWPKIAQRWLRVGDELDLWKSKQLEALRQQSCAIMHTQPATYAIHLKDSIDKNIASARSQTYQIS